MNICPNETTVYDMFAAIMSGDDRDAAIVLEDFTRRLYRVRRDAGVVASERIQAA
jgi:hypothetical protein